MKGAIGFLFFLLFLAGFALVSLHSKKPLNETTAGGSGELTGPDWRAVRLLGNTVPPELELIASFADDGRLLGNAGCNRYSGRYERDGMAFRVAAMRATRRGCDAQVMSIEESLFDVYRHARKLAFAGEELRLMDGDGEWLATFAPQPAVARQIASGT